MGLSRSFWAAGIGTGICLLILMIWRFKMKWKVIITSLGLVIISGLISVMLINFVFGAGINKRVNASDPAASSRWKMLPPLIQEIKQHPIIGSGLGTTITYQSDDPRFKNETNPQGWLTTYAIEWGYLDFVLKFGIIGIMVYLWFLGFIVWEGWKLTKLGNQEAIIAGGFLLGLIVVGATHILSPYLNHPLGIGYVLISIGVFRALKISRELL
jgi:O-antigen ligase